jgi:hypothetical protein
MRQAESPMFRRLLKPQKNPNFRIPLSFYVDFLTRIPFKKFEIQMESCESMLWKSRPDPHAEEKQQCSAIFYSESGVPLSTMFGGASIFFQLQVAPTC